MCFFSSKVDRKKESCFSHFFFFMCAAERLILKEEVGSEENSHCAHADHTATQNSKVNKNRLYVPQFGFIYLFFIFLHHQVEKCVFGDSLKRSSGLFALQTQTLSFSYLLKVQRVLSPRPPCCCVFAWRWALTCPVVSVSHGPLAQQLVCVTCAAPRGRVQRFRQGVVICDSKTAAGVNFV